MTGCKNNRTNNRTNDRTYTVTLETIEVCETGFGEVQFIAYDDMIVR